jgi:hypothetical protein
MNEKSGPPYGDTNEERARELTETGVSVRRSGKGILQLLREALDPAQDESSEELCTRSAARREYGTS